MSHLQTLASRFGVEVSLIKQCLSRTASQLDVPEKEVLRVLSKVKTRPGDVRYLRKAKLSLVAFYLGVSEKEVRERVSKIAKSKKKSEVQVLNDILNELDPVFPLEIFEMIMLYIQDMPTIISMCQTSREMAEFCRSERFWRLKFLRAFGQLSIPKRMTWKNFYYWKMRRRPQLGLGDENIYVDPKGTLYLWSEGPPEKAPVDYRGSQVSASPYTTSFVSQEGELFLWGNNTTGQAGEHVNVEGKPIYYFPTPGKVSWVSCGLFNTGYVITGTLYLLGDNGSGQLSTGSHQAMTWKPVPISLPRVGQVSCGTDHIGAVTWDGKLFTWGSNEHSQLGLKAKVKRQTSRPRRVRIPGYVVQVSCGKYHTGAVTRAGKLYMWGKNTQGQIGNGTRCNSPLPIEIPIPGQVIQVSCGRNFAGVVTRKGEIYTWGENHRGQLGTGDKFSRLSPTHVSVPGKVVEIVCASEGASGVVTQGGRLYLWGKGVLEPRLASF